MIYPGTNISTSSIQILNISVSVVTVVIVMLAFLAVLLLLYLFITVRPLKSRRLNKSKTTQASFTARNGMQFHKLMNNIDLEITKAMDSFNKTKKSERGK